MKEDEEQEHVGGFSKRLAITRHCRVFFVIKIFGINNGRTCIFVRNKGRRLELDT